MREVVVGGVPVTATEGPEVLSAHFAGESVGSERMCGFSCCAPV
jgi:hypothetical protein